MAIGTVIGLILAAASAADSHEQGRVAKSTRKSAEKRRNFLEEARKKKLQMQSKQDQAADIVRESRMRSKFGTSSLFGAGAGGAGTTGRRTLLGE